MKAIPRYKVLSFFLMAVFLLAACRGVSFRTTPVAVARNMGREILGPVKTMAAEGVTVNGLTYDLTSCGKMGGVLLVGHRVRRHGIITDDGGFIVREIKKSAGSSDDQGGWSGPTHAHNQRPNNDPSHDHSREDCHGGPDDAGHHGSRDN